MGNLRPLFLSEATSDLEEEVAVVLDIRLQVELVHETACSLQGALLELGHLLLVISLDTLTLLLGKNLEDVSSTITLNHIATELAFLDSSNSTTQSGF